MSRPPDIQDVMKIRTSESLPLTKQRAPQDPHSKLTCQSSPHPNPSRIDREKEVPRFGYAETSEKQQKVLFVRFRQQAAQTNAKSEHVHTATGPSASRASKSPLCPLTDNKERSQVKQDPLSAAPSTTLTKAISPRVSLHPCTSSDDPLPLP